MKNINREYNREAYLRERMFNSNKLYYLCQVTIRNLSEDFLRECRDYIDWSNGAKDYLKRLHGEKFYTELFGVENG